MSNIKGKTYKPTKRPAITATYYIVLYRSDCGQYWFSAGVCTQNAEDALSYVSTTGHQTTRIVEAKLPTLGEYKNMDEE